jgi:hypothetical protein
MPCQDQIYHSRKPKESPLWKCLHDHFLTFVFEYAQEYEKLYGYFRDIISEVVEKYFDCGDLSKGFARVQCPDCKHEFLLSFSCRGRWFCPCCHQKKVLLFGEFISNQVTLPIPHRQYVFSIPIMLRIFFKYDRKLLTRLCKMAYESLQEYMREILHLPEGQVGIALCIQTFGEYLGWHPHIHAVVTDGLFTDKGWFYVLPGRDIKPLEELFRNKVIKMLVSEKLLNESMGRNLLSWVNSGFSVYQGKPVPREDKKGLEKIAQYIIRNPFSEEKMTYIPETGKVLYKSKQNVKTKRNFEVFDACTFIAAITQHIPEKYFQLVRYYGCYSNKSRGIRAKQKAKDSAEKISEKPEVEVIDISKYESRKVPSKKWRELIKKVWEIDPLICPKCQGEMRIISLVDDSNVIQKILKHLKIWEEPQLPRAPPEPEFQDVRFEPNYDDWQYNMEEYPERLRN